MPKAMTEAEFEAAAARNRAEGEAAGAVSFELLPVLVGGYHAEVLHELARRLRLPENAVLGKALDLLLKETADGDERG